MRLPRRLITADRPLVMAILNATPDSFYAASRADGADAIARRAERLIADGADVIDLGAYSSRPGADEVSPQEETDRLLAACRAVRSVAPTYLCRSTLSAPKWPRIAVEEGGADIVNDITVWRRSGNAPHRSTARSAVHSHAHARHTRHYAVHDTISRRRSDRGYHRTSVERHRTLLTARHSRRHSRSGSWIRQNHGTELQGSPSAPDHRAGASGGLCSSAFRASPCSQKHSA